MKKIFIGSSEQALKKAEKIKTILRELGAEANCWNDIGVFPASQNIFDVLIKAAHQYDGAVFIFDKDDTSITADGTEKFIPRDNVIAEAGMFAGALGKEAVCRCVVPGVDEITDFGGIKYIPYNKPEKIKAELKVWLDNNIESHIVPKSSNNLLMLSRDKIHALYSIDCRFHISDEIYKKIKRIRIMNFASTLMINPEKADVGHIGAGNLHEAIQKTLTDTTNSELSLILINPETNKKDIENKIVNKNAGTAMGTVYSALATMHYNLTNDTIYKRMGDKRFKLYTMEISMPYGILNIEFEEEYKQFNHVKVDLYSAKIGNEDDRRSFVVWQKNDPENYRFFTDNFNQIISDEKICKKATIEELAAWATIWKDMSEKGNG